MAERKLATERGERSSVVDGLLAGLRVSLAEQRQDHLLEQRRFAFGGLAPGLEVPALDTMLHEAGGSLGDGQVACRVCRRSRRFPCRSAIRMTRVRQAAARSVRRVDTARAATKLSWR